MKTLKMKSILFSLLAMLTVAVFLTSCEQTEEIIGGDDSIFLVVEDSELDFPTTLDEFWAAANAETNNPSLNDTEVEDVELRWCAKKVHSINGNRVSWNSNPQYALWIRHYDSSGNYIPGSTQRMDVPYCGTWTKYYNIPSGRCTTVAFVGYQYWGTKSFSCC